MTENAPDNEPDILAALKAGAALGNVRQVDGTPFVVVPEGWEVESLGRMLDTPTHRQGTVTLNDVASFVDYVKRYLAASKSLVYMAVPTRIDQPPRFVAVLDEHPPAGATIAGWRRFRAIYAPIMAPEWMTWTAANKQAMDQAKFSQFIEDNLPDVAQPPGADLLTITRSIEAKKKVNFASSIRLSDGSHQLTFEEEVQGSAAKGQLTIPESIRLAIPVLLNGPRYAVDARLRYRIDQAGKLALWVDLLRPHEIVQHAVTEARKTIADGTGLQVLVGLPD